MKSKREGPKEARTTIGEVAAQIAALGGMTVGELREKFLKVYGEPTRSSNKVYLRKKIAWQIQALAEGGLSQRALDRIDELAPLAPIRWRPSLKDVQLPGGEEGKRQTPRDPRLPPAGTVLPRVHKGTEHKVEVLVDGFAYDGKRYPSLSQVARAITGTHWNGFLFFGLTGQKEAGTGGTP
jgi:hypothetical protein